MTTSRQGGSGSRAVGPQLRASGRPLRWALLCATVLTGTPALAQQSGFAVKAGSATISTPNANTTVVTETTGKAVITWQTLNVAYGSTLQFIQPNSSAIVLNRVLGGSASQIDGSLLANGIVWIINPAGVMFGQGASVNVAGLIATTSNISDQNFLAGAYSFDQPTADAQAAIVNLGTITVAPGGAAVLAGARVTNSGLIEADLGKVVLASGNAFTVDFTGDSLISFAVSSPLAVTPLDRNGNPASSLVSNSGTLSAAGGEVLLTAQAARNVLTNAINVTGMIEATSAHEENGEIVLDAGPGNVTLGPNSVLDASGDQGGGSISVSGGNLTVFQGALLDASAGTSGNGGAVTLQASDTLTFDGTISVTGGAEAGNGGFADTSGASITIATGTVDALAPAGNAGTWLLDPANITVASGGTAALANLSGFDNDFGESDTIDPSVIDNAAANVVLEATNEIKFSSPVTMVNSGVGITAIAGDTITVDAAITTSGGAITFTANSNAGGTASGSGSILLVAPINTLGTAVSAGAVSLTVSGGTGTVTTSYSGAGAAITGGTVTVSTNAAVTLPAIAASGTLEVTAPGISQSGAVSVGNETFLDAGSSDIELADVGNNFGSAVLVTAGNATIAASSPIQLGFSGVAQNLTVSAPGISQNAAMSVGGTLSLTVGAGNSIDLDYANSFAGPIVLTDSSFYDLTLDNTVAAITLPALTISHNLSVAAPGISQSGAVSVGNETFLDAGSSDIELADVGNNFGSAVLVTAGNATIAASSPIQLGFSGVAQNLTVSAPGISQNAAMSVGGTLSLTVGAGNSIDLDYANSFAGPIVLTDSSFYDLTLDNTVAAITLPALTISHNLSVAAPGISQSGAVSVGNETFLDAGSSDIELADVGNNFGSAVLVTAGNATIAASSPIQLGFSGVAQNLTVSAPGISQNAAMSVGGTLSLTVGAGNSIDLDYANSFAGPIVLTDSSFYDLTLDNTVAAITLPALTISHNLSVAAPGISQSGAVSVGNETFLGAGSSDIELADVGNNFGSAVLVTAGNATIAASSPIQLGFSGVAQNLTVSAPGISQNAAMSVGGTLSLTVGAGNSIDLDYANSFAGPIVLTDSSFYDLTLDNTVAAITLPGLEVSGDLTVTAPGITQTAAISVGGTATLAATGGEDIKLTNPANSFGSFVVTSGGDVAIDATGAITVGAVTATSFTLTSSGPITLTDAIATSSDFDALTSGNIVVTGGAENSGAGSITLVAGWDGVTPAASAATTAGAYGLDGGSVIIGGPSASGNASVGSAGGTTTVAAANLELQGENGYAQLGYVGGGATGNIVVTLTGNLTLSAGGAGDYAQIGHGGAGTSGSESGTIGIAAAGTITLIGGSGTDAYAQIGHGGALSNFGTTFAFSDTGDISLSGTVVTLNAGLGDGAYAQIGHGGLGAGESATVSTGSIVLSGNIDLTAMSNLVLTGDGGTGAYAQIGNGGFGADANATLLSGGAITETGDIVIATGTAASAGSININGDAYAQIGNGGYQENSNANASGINESGNISLSLNGGSGTINAGDEGNFAYGQVGNGDAARTGDGNVSGNIEVSSSAPWTLNDSSSALAWMGNATGTGTVSGITQIDGASPPPPPPPDLEDEAGLNSVLASNEAPPPSPDSDSSGQINNTGSDSNGTSGDNGSNLGQNLNNIVPTAGSSSAGAIEQMTDSSGGSGSGEAPAGAGQEANELSSALALSLTKVSAPVSSQSSSCIRTNSGTTILCELAPDAGAGKTPVGVQPADQPYSSWGNESLWQQ